MRGNDQLPALLHCHSQVKLWASSMQITHSASWRVVQCWGEAETADGHPAKQRDWGRPEKWLVPGM